MQLHNYVSRIDFKAPLFWSLPPPLYRNSFLFFLYHIIKAIEPHSLQDSWYFELCYFETWTMAKKSAMNVLLLLFIIVEGFFSLLQLNLLPDYSLKMSVDNLPSLWFVLNISNETVPNHLMRTNWRKQKHSFIYFETSLIFLW